MARWRKAVLAGLGAAWASGRIIAWSKRLDLRGKVVLITGGSRGLGLELARTFAARGAQLALCSRDEGELLAAQRELRAESAFVEVFPCDVSVEEEARRTVRQVEEMFGGIDVLVNNAGIIQVGPAKSMSLEDFRSSLDANFWGMVHMTWAVLPHFRSRGSGRLVNITSIGGEVAVPHLLPYSSAKFAAVGFSTGLASELAQEGIVVTTVVPGLLRTGSHGAALFKGDREREFRWFGISAGIPGITMGSARAARQIVRACIQGRSYVTLGLPAKILRAGTLFPRVTGAALALAARTLPEASSAWASEPAEPGRKHRSETPPALTPLADAAAQRNNEDPRNWR